MRIRWVYIGILLLLVGGCAKEEAPLGGPEDETPPMLLGTTPRSGEFGVPVSTRIEVEFSERIERKTVTDAIFISPPLKNEPRISVKGSRIVIEPDGPLDSVRTYVVTIGARTADIHGNNLRNSISFAFATGWTIDSSTIRGRIYDNFAPLRNFQVFAYELSPFMFDSLFTLFPDYITQTGENGDFKFEFMRQATYLVIGVADSDHDNLINPGSEKIALAQGLIVSSPPTDSIHKFHLFHITQYDSSRVEVLSCRGEQGHVDITLGGAPVDSTSLVRDSIRIIARDSSEFTPDAVAFLGADRQRLHLWSTKLLTDSTYTVEVGALRGNNGRPVSEENKRCLARLRGADETPPKVQRQAPRREFLVLRPEDSLLVTYSEPIIFAEDAAYIKIDSTTTIAIPPVSLDALTFAFPPDSTLRPSVAYTLTIENAGLNDLYGNRPPDSIYNVTFMLADPDSLGQLSGMILSADSNLVVLLSGLGKHLEYEFSGLRTGEYNWQLYPDNYLLRAYADNNGNGAWDLGTLNPFSFAEPGWTLPDTVRVRARFEYTDFDLHLE
ncbi:MAG: Ig-like domain-containing protein [bacterium]